MRLEIDVLKTFIAVAETGSVKCAAERVGRSPAAVSMQMKKLEVVGAPVFHLRVPCDFQILATD